MKILVPLDGSDNSMRSIDFLANTFKEKLAELEITLIYVVMYELYVMSSPEIIERVGKQRADETMTAAEAAFKRYNPNANITRTVECGSSAADIIVAVAEQGNFDMIVMGSTGISNLKRFILGSTSTRVSQYAPCTVVLVR